MEREWSQGHFHFLANGVQKEKKKVLLSHQEIKFIISLNVNKLLKINYENKVKIYFKIFFFKIKYQKLPFISSVW